ncbi:hypothetical protein CVT26_010286 [Gymnopilus dilepis]|uniref:Uncharacterized protein n=1 Tax=Gymnopilus dilepis TaxID=231916 RepID=A0A409Y1A7_9AGAR|nr:hypothetical protein CVT26_010286 [Gymnopilus dilepis]
MYGGICKIHTPSLTLNRLADPYNPSESDIVELAVLTDDDYTAEFQTSSYPDSEDNTEIYIPVTRPNLGLSQALLQVVEEELAKQDRDVGIRNEYD